MSNHNEWPKSKVDSLKVLFKEGLTCRQIGMKMGKTRNAIIGKIDRLGWREKKQKIRNGPEVKKEENGPEVKKEEASNNKPSLFYVKCLDGEDYKTFIMVKEKRHAS